MLVVCAYAAFALVWMAPVVTHFSSRILRPTSSEWSDGSASLRDLWALDAMHKTSFTAGRDVLVGAPEGLPLSQAVAVADPAQPLFLLASGSLVGRVASWNLYVLFGFVITAVAGFFVLRLLGIGASAAFVGGYAIAFNPWMVEHARWGSAGLIQLWGPLVVSVAIIFDWRRRTRFSALVLGIAAGLAFYLVFYLGVLAVLLCALYALFMIVGLRRRPARGTVVRPALSLVGLAVTLVPVFLASLSGISAAVVSRDGRDFYGVGFRRFLLPSADNPLLGWAAQGGGRSADVELFAGWFTVVFAVVGVVAAVRAGGRRRALALYACAAVVLGATLALPEHYIVGGRSFPTPSLLAAAVVPEFRIVARYGVLVLVGVVLLASLGLDRIAVRTTRVWVPLLALPLVALEFAVGPPVKTWNTRSATADVRWLAAHPGGIVAVYPMLDFAGAVSNMESQEQSEQPVQGHPLFNLYGGDPRRFAGTEQMAIRAATKYPEGPVAGVLAAEHVRYVVVRTDVYRAIGVPAPNLAEGFRHVAEVADGVIYEVTAAPISGGGGRLSSMPTARRSPRCSGPETSPSPRREASTAPRANRTAACAGGCRRMQRSTSESGLEGSRPSCRSARSVAHALVRSRSRTPVGGSAQRS